MQTKIHSLKFAAALLVVSAWAIAPAHADVTYLQRSTALTASGRTADCVENGCFDTGTIQSGTTSLGDFSDSLNYGAGGLTSFATASQQSSLSSGGIKVQSRATSDALSLGEGSSLFSVQFTLDAAENFHFFGQTFNTADIGSSSGMRLTGPGVDVAAEYWDFSGGDTDVYNADASGVLAPGTYTFVVSAISSGQTWSGAAFAQATSELDLTPVPLPSTWMLMLAGLVSLGIACGTRGRSRREDGPSILLAA